MANKKTSNKKVKEIKIEEIIEVQEIVISKKDQIKKDLKEIQILLNGGYDTKNRSSLLNRQMELQIQLKSL